MYLFLFQTVWAPFTRDSRGSYPSDTNLFTRDGNVGGWSRAEEGKNWFRTKIHWLIRNIFRQSYNKIRILKWWYQIWIVPWSTQQRKTLHVTHKTGFHRIDANNILSFLQFENITVWQLANSALLGTNRLNHTTINTFSDTRRSEFVLFVIEK